MLRDRLLKGIELYQSGVAPKLLMSGDHGTKGYDEVNVMKNFALEMGVASSDAVSYTHLDVYKRQEQKNATILELKRQMAHDYEDFTRLKSQVQQLQAGAKQHREQLEQQRKELEATIPADELAWYESVKNKCGGTPVAMLNADHVCSGCHTIVPPITFKRTTLGQKTVCENCGRTLFVED